MIRVSEELPRAVSKVIEAVRSLGLEGVIAIRRDLYQPSDRSSDWLRLKLESQREFVIGGFRPNGASIDALLVGTMKARHSGSPERHARDFVLHGRRQCVKSRPV